MRSVTGFVSEQHPLLVLTRAQTQELLTMKETLELVEYAFRLYGEGKVVMPPKLYLDDPTNLGDFRAMPAYIDGNVGLKWVSVFPENWRRDLPTVLATIILSDPENGCPLAVMDGTYITEMRTGAAGGVAAKYLARRNSSVVGVIGSGVQARTQLLAIGELLPGIQELKVFDKNRDASLLFAEEMKTKLKMRIFVVDSIEEAAKADIVVTTTPSTKPIIRQQSIMPGTHINAIGADAEGKQELEVELLRNAKIVVDDIEQAQHSGEINVAISNGLIKIEDVYGTLGEVVVNSKEGRENDQEITIFDSTGLAMLDLICAGHVYQKASKRDARVRSSGS